MKFLRGDGPAVEIANRLREFREARGLTQARLAKKAKVSRATIAALENASESADPRLSTLRALAHVLCVSVGEIVDGDLPPLLSRTFSVKRTVQEKQKKRK